MTRAARNQNNLGVNLNAIAHCHTNVNISSHCSPKSGSPRVQSSTKRSLFQRIYFYPSVGGGGNFSLCNAPMAARFTQVKLLYPCCNCDGWLKPKVRLCQKPVYNIKSMEMTSGEYPDPFLTAKRLKLIGCNCMLYWGRPVTRARGLLPASHLAFQLMWFQYTSFWFMRYYTWVILMTLLHNDKCISFICYVINILHFFHYMDAYFLICSILTIQNFSKPNQLWHLGKPRFSFIKHTYFDFWTLQKIR